MLAVHAAELWLGPGFSDRSSPFTTVFLAYSSRPTCGTLAVTDCAVHFHDSFSRALVVAKVDDLLFVLDTSSVLMSTIPQPLSFFFQKKKKVKDPGKPCVCRGLLI